MSIIYIPNPVPTLSSYEQLSKLLNKGLKPKVFNWELELKNEHIIILEDLQLQLKNYLDLYQHEEVTLILDSFASYLYYPLAELYSNMKQIIILNPMGKKIARKRINIKNTLLPTSMTNTVYKYMYLFKSLDGVRNNLDWLSSIRAEQVLIDDKDLALHKLIDQLLNHKVIKQHDKWLSSLNDAHFISGSHNLLSPINYLKHQIASDHLHIIDDCGFNLIWEQNKKFNQILMELCAVQEPQIEMITNSKRQAIFPGSFNPFHEGHLHIIKHALANDFDFIYLVIAQNPNKIINDFETNYTKINTILEEAELTSKVKVLIEPGNVPLLAQQMKISHIIRGYRNDQDWSYEQQLKALYQEHNALLKFKIYLADQQYQTVASSKKK